MQNNMNQTVSGGTLKDFQILNKLGEGTFSQVFKVKRLSDGKEYAMKKVMMQSLKEKEKENSLNEVRILASLSDDYIVGYKEAFIENNELYVIMELCPQGDIQILLNEYIVKQQLIEEKEIWKAFVDILKGLNTLHDMQILHRDLKCANIFISKDGNYKLGDLNVSKIAKRGLVYTQTGTPYYVAPEIWRDEAYDLKCDIWSVGCVIYEMCAQRPPFRAPDLEQLNKKIQKGIFDRIPNKYSNDLQAIIQQCLKISPSQRPNTKSILNNPTFLRNAGADLSSINSHQLNQQQQQQQLLQTIKCPQNLTQLKGKLPRSKYNPDNNKSVQNKQQILESNCSPNNRDDLSQSRKNRILSAGPQQKPINPKNCSNNQQQPELQQNQNTPKAQNQINSRPPISNKIPAQSQNQSPVNNAIKDSQSRGPSSNLNLEKIPISQSQSSQQQQKQQRLSQQEVLKIISSNNTNNIQGNQSQQSSRHRILSNAQENINPNIQNQNYYLGKSKQKSQNEIQKYIQNNDKSQQQQYQEMSPYYVQHKNSNNESRPYSAKIIEEQKLKLPPLNPSIQHLNQKLNNKQQQLLGSCEQTPQNNQMNRYSSEKHNIGNHYNYQIKSLQNPTQQQIQQEYNYEYDYYNNAHRQIRRMY